MADKSFSFDTGLRSYDINGYIVTFNPTDSRFITGFNKLLKKLNVKQDELAEIMRDAGDDADIVIDTLGEYGTYSVEAFDTCFGAGASDGMFGGCSPFTVQPDTRIPLWVILCDYIANEIMTALDELPEEAKTDKLLMSGAKSKALLQKYKIKAQAGK